MIFAQRIQGFASLRPERKAFLHSLGVVLALACFVFVMEETMHWVGFFNQTWQAMWWPTNGFALALMVRSERRQWPIILAGTLLGSLFGELHYNVPSSLNAVNALANTVGPLVGALALPRLRKIDTWLQEPHLVSRFVAFALVLGPGLSALLFACYMKLSSPGLDFSTVLQVRADSDMLGYAMFTPLVLTVTRKEQYQGLRITQLLVPALLLALVGATTWVVFNQSAYSLAFVLLSVVMLVSMRLGFASSVLAVNLMAILATNATMHGHGPLILGSGSILTHRIFLLQAFLALTMITVFSVSVMQIERMVYQTRLQGAYREMEKLASTDALTGVGNRRRFEDALRAEWARALRTGDSLAVLLIDVDHFKSYNDDFGHPAGDDCLRSIATAVLDLEHRSSDLLARYGGEEFIYLLPATTLDGAASVAQRIREQIQSLFIPPESSADAEPPASSLLRRVTVSIGCAAIVPNPDTTPDQIIRASDEALYRAKQGGRNRVELGGLRLQAGLLNDLDPVL